MADLPTELKIPADKYAQIAHAMLWYNSQPDFLNEVLGDRYHENISEWLSAQLPDVVDGLCGEEYYYTHIDQDGSHYLLMFTKVGEDDVTHAVKLLAE